MTNVKCRFQKSLPNLIMKEFSFRIRKENGLHARPAGQLVSLTEKYTSNITLGKDNKIASAKGLFALMGLGIAQGDNITVKCEGDDEEVAYEALKEFFENNFSEPNNKKI